MKKKKKQYAQKLLLEYLELREKRNDVNEKFHELKSKIVGFAKEHKQTSIRSDDAVMKISIKRQVVFPSKNEPGRKGLEQVMRRTDELEFAMSFDIIKLAESYQKRELSKKVRTLLKPYVRREEVVRVSVREKQGGL